ncbi:hypothetical protein GCM10009854_32540 [Saccharopolyspora halophila]|uniref:Uncharacterized protein n=1 Tax=Saccharopolyspora halophila TaxID=405551 RepID=A0ABN3GI70_9PSEU
MSNHPSLLAPAAGAGGREPVQAVVLLAPPPDGLGRARVVRAEVCPAVSPTRAEWPSPAPVAVGDPSLVVALTA